MPVGHGWFKGGSVVVCVSAWSARLVIMGFTDEIFCATAGGTVCLGGVVAVGILVCVAGGVRGGVCVVVFFFVGI